MPAKKYHSDSEFDLGNCSEIQSSSQHYNTITYQMRLKLIQLVLQNRLSIIKASKQLDIKLSTAKFIINSYKKKGKIMKRKSQVKKQKLFPQKIQVKSQKQSPLTSNEVKIQEDKPQPQISQEKNEKIPVQPPVYITPQMLYYFNFPGIYQWHNGISRPIF